MENGSLKPSSNSKCDCKEVKDFDKEGIAQGNEEVAESTADECSSVDAEDPSKKECKIGDAVGGDGEYELDREEPTSPSSHDWKIILMKAEFAEDLCEQIRKIKPYERCKKTGRIIPTRSFRDLVQGYFMFLDSGTKVPLKVMRNLTKEVFACCDLLFEISRVFADRVLQFNQKSLATWFNVFHFLKSIPDPRASVIPRLFKVVHHPLKVHKKKKLIRMFQENWIGFMRCKIHPKVLSVVIPYISENILDGLDEPYKTADFFFRAFEKGDMLAILSLEAIFKLIVSNNFEYPNFYDHVYSLTKPSVLYLDHKEKFISLLDKFLSSTHIPNYVVAGFAKRLSRILLLSPVDVQEPVLGLIRNLLTRHPNVSCLIHRDIPDTLSSDPYNEEETCLNKCNALDSSLWEIKSLQKHWHPNVAKRASFVDRKLQQVESFVRFRCQDELFSNMMAKAFGSSEQSVENKYTRAQDGSDEEEVQPKKKIPKRGKFVVKHEERREHGIPISFTAPSGQLFPDKSFNLAYEKFWCA